MPPLEAVKVLASIMMSVGWSSNCEPLKLRHYDISKALTSEQSRGSYVRLEVEDRQKYGEDRVGKLNKSMCGTQVVSHIWQLDHVNLICGELGRLPKRSKHSAAFIVPHCKTGCEDAVMTCCVCQT